LGVVIPFEQQTLFADDVERIARVGDGVEVKALRVVGAILEGTQCCPPSSVRRIRLNTPIAAVG